MLGYLEQVINFVLLTGVIALSLRFVGRDARKKGSHGLRPPGGRRFRYSLSRSASPCIFSGGRVTQRKATRAG